MNIRKSLHPSVYAPVYTITCGNLPPLLVRNYPILILIHKLKKLLKPITVCNYACAHQCLCKLDLINPAVAIQVHGVEYLPELLVCTFNKHLEFWVKSAQGLHVKLMTGVVTIKLDEAIFRGVNRPDDLLENMVCILEGYSVLHILGLAFGSNNLVKKNSSPLTMIDPL